MATNLAPLQAHNGTVCQPVACVPCGILWSLCCRLIPLPTLTTALQPNPEHLQNQLQLPRISRKLLIRTTLHTALCPCSNIQAVRRVHLLDGAVSS